MQNCPLCRSDLAPIIATSPYWRLILNHNQNFLGKCFLVLQRHTETIIELTPDEWNDLYQQITRSTRMLVVAFSPDHFNYAFLQNQDRHVHLHIVPRYASQRIFIEQPFVDSDYPAHYSVPAPSRTLPLREFTALATYLHKCFEN